MTISTDPSGPTQLSSGNDRRDKVEGEISKDDLFFILQNERRRLVLQYLADSEEVVEMRGLVEQVAAWEYNTTPTALTSNDRQRVYIALYQSHLPSLDKVGLITYNQSRGIVTQTGRMEQILPYIEAGAKDHENNIVEESGPAHNEPSDEIRRVPMTWGRYFAVVTVFNMLLVGAVWAGLRPVASISSRGLTAAITAIYAVLTVGMILRP